MTIEQDARETVTSFAEKGRERILEWIKIAGVAPNSLAVRLRRIVAGKRKSIWTAFAIVLAGNIIAFNYYQARITRYHLSNLLMNIVRMNEDIDTLEAKINQLNKKTDDIGAKLNKPVPVLSTSPASNLTKPRSR